MTASRWTVLCDFDGTIALEDVTDSLLMRFARPGWTTLETAWRDGRIDARTCMAGQVALLECTRGELTAYLATVAIDPDFAPFAEAVRAAGMRLAIVSDGLDHACRAILDRHSLRHMPVIANRLVQEGTRRWRLDFPNARADCRSGCGTCKCAHAPLDDRAPVLLIGDGASDFCPAERATFVFARDSLLARCRDLALPHRPVANFREARALLRGLASVPCSTTAA